MAEPGIRRLVEIVGEGSPVHEGAHQQEHRQHREIGIERDVEDLLRHHLQRRFPAPQDAKTDTADQQHGKAQREAEKGDQEKDCETDERNEHESLFHQFNGSACLRA